MGYTTDFTGSFKINKPLTPEQKDYLQRFNQSRRMKRDVQKLKELYAGKWGMNGEYGHEGEYYANPGNNSGQDEDETIIDYNAPAGAIESNGSSWESRWEKKQERIKEGKIGQPSLWCKWTVNEDGTELIWNEGEKFYYYIEWLKYLLNHFFIPWGYILNGEVVWQGEDSEDRGKIHVINNEVKVFKGETVYKEINN